MWPGGGSRRGGGKRGGDGGSGMRDSGRVFCNFRGAPLHVRPWVWEKSGESVHAQKPKNIADGMNTPRFWSTTVYSTLDYYSEYLIIGRGGASYSRCTVGVQSAQRHRGCAFWVDRFFARFFSCFLLLFLRLLPFRLAGALFFFFFRWYVLFLLLSHSSTSRCWGKK